MKKLISVLLALAMVCCLLPTVVFASETVDSGTCGDNLTWVLDDEGTLTISGEGEMNQGYKIGNEENIKTVIIEYGVTSIDDYVFYMCTNLISVIIPESVTKIGSNAFGGCISLPNVQIPESVTEIEESAFSGCASLSSVRIPASVSAGVEVAFDGCQALKEIIVDPSNPYYSSDDRGVLFNKDKTVLMMAPRGIEGHYAIPDGVTEIGMYMYAFFSCDSLTSVFIPASVTQIGDIGDTDLNDFDASFSSCASLTEIIVDPANPYYSSDEYGVLFNKDKTTLYQVPGAMEGTYIIPDGVTRIRRTSFMNCSKLTEVVIPEGVTSLEYEVFGGCKSLTSVTLPQSITFIGDYAFDSCSSLNRIVFPSGVESIGLYVLSSSDIQEIIFEGDAPDLICSFCGLTADVYYPADNPTWTEEAMHDCEGKITWIPYTPDVPTETVPGDLNGNDIVDDTDVAHLLWHTLFPDAYEISGNADFNGDNTVDDADVAYLLWHTLFPENYPLD